MQGQGC